jgi:methylamine dehydrogenase light chain
MKLFNPDAAAEKLLRRFAGGTSRRGMLAWLGTALVAAPAFRSCPSAAPVPPSPIAARGQDHFARKAQTVDDTKCDYWRYCAIDGALCSCCGGGIHTPPGAESSPVSWVGTCINPEDGKAYMIAYRDCCGKPMCTRCMCDNQDRETPLYAATQQQHHLVFRYAEHGISLLDGGDGRPGLRIGRVSMVKWIGAGLSLALPVLAATVAATPDTARGISDPELARSDFVEHCGGCHGPDGRSAPAALPELRAGWGG